MFHSLAKLCQACCSSVSVVSNFFCVNGLCSPICLARREGANPESCVLLEVRECRCAAAHMLHPAAGMVQQGAGGGSTGLVCDSHRRCCQLPSVVSMWDGYPQLTLVKPKGADRSWEQAEVCRISVTLWRAC